MQKLAWLLLIFMLPVQAILSQNTAESDLYVTAYVDNPTPYVGEQVVYSFNIFNSISLTTNPDYGRPDFEGFWRVEELPPSDAQSGRYSVTSVRTVLFARTVGEQVIQPGRLTFSNNSVVEPEQTLLSNTVTVNARPLPDGAPAGFDGAVGSPFFIEAWFTRSAVMVGDPLTLNVAVEGAGNIELLNPPFIEFPVGWRLYPQPAAIRISTEGGLVSGRKVFSWLILPSEAGEYQVSAVQFHYFDPRLGAYQSLVTEPLRLEVLPSNVQGVVEPLLTTNLPTDDMRLQPKPLTAITRGVNFPLGWWLWLIPPLVTIVATGWQWSRVERARLGRQQASQQALRHARASLAAVTRARDEEAAYRQFVQAVWGYFAEKWGKPLATLTPSDIQLELVQRKVDAELVTRLFRCVQAAEERRYAPGEAGSMRGVLKQTLAALVALDQALEQA